MVAFAGRKYAARSLAAFVANSSYTVTSFTLVRISELESVLLILVFAFSLPVRT